MKWSIRDGYTLAIKKNRNKGITLIALVLTIIVLLILAGVSIAMLTGENGILNQARKAKEETKIATEDEQRKLTQTEAIMNMKNKEYIDSKGKKAIIPAGFAVSQVEGERNIDTGLVIIDSDGNEFVWVPVDGTTIEYKKHEYVTTSVDDTTGSIADTGNENWKTFYYRKYSDWTDEVAEANKASVTEYGGFYVARYEAGVPSDADFYADKAGDAYYTSYTTPSKNVATYKPVSKANNQSWNYISQENALTVASKMYEGSNSVKSQLIDGYAWDAIATWMGNDSAYPNIHADSTNYGNYYTSSFSLNNVFNAKHKYSGGWIPASQYEYGSVVAPKGTGTDRAELATGSLDSAKVKNIYDFAGNMWEWTTETGNHNASGAKYAALRGGCFSDYGTSHPVSSRNGNNVTASASVNMVFRVALYL